MDRPRGLGRGLSALLGEPVRTDIGDKHKQHAPPPQTAQQSAPAWIPPSSPVAQPQPPAAPQAEAPANVVELPKAFTPPPPAEAPPPAVEPSNIAPAALPPEEGPKGLPIDLIQRNPGQPRKTFDEAELNELAASIRTRGVLQPILVRPIPGGRYEIVAGERRWRAAQRAGLHSIPAVVRELDEVEVLEIAIIENVQRADLNPLEEAQGYQALIDRFGRTQQELADVVGKSRPHIANMLRLLSLPGDIQDMVRDGRLTAGHARAILTAPDPMALALRAIKDGLNVREIERLAANAKEQRDGPRVSSSAAEKDADTREMEGRLSDMLGLAVTITTKGEGGELRISYKRLEQLDDIARRLSS
ncbi:MAG: ParB/RepB/Spo0J family partition protein [Alphaproteobacteria bacterium]|nr:ParB/RepB/Spo0J family partition protein [Alphaproteobacteria bacterium]